MNTPELRAIIVDDEAPAREVLQELLECHPHVKVIGEANSVATAAALCHDLRPNLIFLDVQMDGEQDGFSLLPKLDLIPAVIFVTAYDQFAIRAFEVNAIDYLLKPIDPARLTHALERITHQPQPVFTERLRECDQIYLKSDKNLRMVYVTEISGIEAQENYSLVHLTDGASMLIRQSMAEWEKCLPKQFFVRPHRSLIVNVQSVKKVVVNKPSEIEADIAGFPALIRLGRRAAAKLRRALRKLNLL